MNIAWLCVIQSFINFGSFTSAQYQHIQQHFFNFFFFSNLEIQANNSDSKDAHQNFKICSLEISGSDIGVTRSLF